MMGLPPIIQLVDIVKKEKCLNKEVKTLFSDLITIFGQIQYNLSLRRRYFVRPYLKNKYSSLCNMSTPITTKLFGDDISKEVKSCDALSYWGKESPYSSYRGGPQRFRGKYRRENYATSYQTGFRTQPYPSRSTSFRFGQASGRARLPRRTSTVTSSSAGTSNNQE